MLRQSKGMWLSILEKNKEEKRWKAKSKRCVTKTQGKMQEPSWVERLRKDIETTQKPNIYVIYMGILGNSERCKRFIYIISISLLT